MPRRAFLRSVPSLAADLTKLPHRAIPTPTEPQRPLTLSQSWVSLSRLCCRMRS